MNQILLDPYLPDSQQNWLGLNSLGFAGPWSRLAEGSIYGGDGRLRFGRISTNGEQRFALAISGMDAPSNGARRSELIAYDTPETRVPVGEDFWYGANWKFSEGLVASDSLVITQWLQLGAPPCFATYLTNGKLSVSVRHNLGGRIQTLHLWTDAIVRDGEVNLVIQARLSHTQGLLRLWIDGDLVHQYVGAFGYQGSYGGPFAKIGPYWWEGGNPWDTSQGYRRMDVRKAVIVRAPYGPGEVIS